jgi:hypothetical protein
MLELICNSLKDLRYYLMICIGKLLNDICVGAVVDSSDSVQSERSERCLAQEKGSGQLSKGIFVG